MSYAEPNASVQTYSRPSPSRPQQYEPRPRREKEFDFAPLEPVVPLVLGIGALYVVYQYRDKLYQTAQDLFNLIQGKVSEITLTNPFTNITLPGIDDSSKANPPPTSSGTGTPITGGTTDGNGIKIPYRMTGKYVKMNYGSRHPNGDRYNANHSLQNYYVVGYYLTQGGSGKRLIEMKTDGPNHSGCTSLPKCEWVELDFDISSGQAYISSEYPHPQNHPAVTQGVNAIKLNGNFVGKYIGFGVAAWTDPVDGFRVYEEWIDPGGVGANQWVRTLHAKNTGQIIPNPKRALPTGGAGMEAEIRMNNQHSTEMKFGNIYEIVPPTISARAYGYEMRPLYAPRVVIS